jgi:mRNA-degrading endonuclease RelE of RelBE toxin-antitoxin system
VGVKSEYRLIYSETVRTQIAKLHPEIKSVIRSRLDNLRTSPFIGKRLERELSGYRSLRAERFRIIYKIDEKSTTIEIHSVGNRKNIYELFAEKANELL